MNQKGQEFESYRLLIGIIMALFILGIITGAITYFEQLRLDISEQRLTDGFHNAIENLAPEDFENSSPIVIDDLLLEEGFYNTAFFTQNTIISKECLSFQSENIANFDVKTNGIEVKKRILSDIYLLCHLSSDSDCSEQCIVSFGKPITSSQ